MTDMDDNVRVTGKWIKVGANYLGVGAGILSAVAALRDEWSFFVFLGLVVFDIWIFWFLFSIIFPKLATVRIGDTQKWHILFSPSSFILFLLITANVILISSGYVKVLYNAAIYGEAFPPLHAEQHPHYRDSSLSFVVHHDWYGSFIIPPVDPEVVRIREIDVEEHLSSQKKYCALEYMGTSMVARIYLSGQSNSDPVFVDNHVWIKILSYKPVSKMTHWGLQPAGGGGSFYWLSGKISREVVGSDDKITIADPITFLEEERNLLPSLEYPDTTELSSQDMFLLGSKRLANVPNEILISLQNKQLAIPDYFTLNNAEPLALGVSTVFEDPGIYEIQYGIKYTVGHYSKIAYAQPSSLVYVAENFILWHPVLEDGMDGRRYYQMESCVLAEAGKYQCSDVCEETDETNGVECPN